LAFDGHPPRKASRLRDGNPNYAPSASTSRVLDLHARVCCARSVCSWSACSSAKSWQLLVPWLLNFHHLQVVHGGREPEADRAESCAQLLPLPGLRKLEPSKADRVLAHQVRSSYATRQSGWLLMTSAAKPPPLNSQIAASELGLTKLMGWLC